MPLSDRSKLLLHEIYQVPRTNTTVVSGGYATASMSVVSWDYYRGVRDQLLEAIDTIDADEVAVQRVEEILVPYTEISTDRSHIDRDGYSFRPGRNLQAIKEALYPYTGIIMESRRGGNTFGIG